MIIARLKILLFKIRIFGFIRLTSFVDYTLYKLKFTVATHVQPQNTIIYLGDNFSSQIARTVKWSKRSGDYHAVLICQKDGFNKKFSNEYFDEIILFRNKWHLYRILSNVRNARLIYGFGPKAFYPDLARKFMKGTKFIYDLQDVVVNFYGTDPGIKWFYDEFPHEKNCLEFADGIVSRSLEPIAGFKLYNIKKKNNTLFFPNYCDNDFFQDNQKNTDNEIHIVYAGGIQNSTRDKRQFGDIHFHGLINELSKQKLHFHVYPSPYFLPVYFSEYVEISRHNPYFHLHQSVEQTQLTKELSKYHFGIIPFFKENTAQSSGKYRYSTSLKLFNFIEAGIPIIISKDITFQCWFAKRYNAAIPVEKKDIANLRKILEGIDYPETAGLLINSRNSISLKRNISRINEFYNRIAPLNK